MSLHVTECFGGMQPGHRGSRLDTVWIPGNAKHGIHGIEEAGIEGSAGLGSDEGKVNLVYISKLHQGVPGTAKTWAAAEARCKYRGRCFLRCLDQVADMDRARLAAEDRGKKRSQDLSFLPLEGIHGCEPYEINIRVMEGMAEVVVQWDSEILGKARTLW